MLLTCRLELVLFLMPSHGIWPIKTKINTSSSTSPHGVPKHKNQHLQFRIEIMPKKEELYLSKKSRFSGYVNNIKKKNICGTFSLHIIFKKNPLYPFLESFWNLEGPHLIIPLPRHGELHVSCSESRHVPIFFSGVFFFVFFEEHLQLLLCTKK